MFSTFLNWSIAAILTSFTILPVSFSRQSAPTAEPEIEAAALKGCAVKKFDDLVQFRYIGIDYQQINVEDVEKWEYVEGDEHDCLEEKNERACSIWVSEEFVNPATIFDPPTLKDSLILSSSSQLPNIYYITGSNDSAMDFFNEEQP